MVFSARSAQADLQYPFHLVAVTNLAQGNMPTNRAAWLVEPKSYPFQIKDAPFHRAGPGEVVIRNIVTALVSCGAALMAVRQAKYHATDFKAESRRMENPVRLHAAARKTEGLFQSRDLGVIVQKYPTILGADAAGYIEEVGEGVTHLQKGQRVIGCVHDPASHDLTNQK